MAIHNVVRIIRIGFYFATIVFGSAVCVQVFTAYGVNYIFIFQLDPTRKVTYHQLYRIAALLYSVCLFSFCLCIMQIKLDHVFITHAPIFIYGFVAFFLIYCMQPFHECGHRTARFQLANTVLQIFMAPFGTVRFRDFFFADIITSMGHILGDIGFAIYFAGQSDIHSNSGLSKHNNTLKYYLMICSILPYWFRFWQCLHKWYHQGVTR